MKFRLPALIFLAFLLFVLSGPLGVSAISSNLERESTQEATFKNKLEQLKEEFRLKKEEFQNTRLKLGSKATEGARKDALLKAKNVVLKILDRTIERIQNLIDRVEKSPVLTAERKTAIVADLKTQIDLVKAQKSKVEGATNGDELRAVLKETKTQLASVRETVKKIVSQILASHIDRTLAKLEEIANRLESQIANLKNQGVDVSKLQSQLDYSRTKISQAREANNNGDFKLARKRAEEARTILVQIRGEIKSLQAKLKKATKSATPKSATEGGQE